MEQCLPHIHPKPGGEFDIKSARIEQTTKTQSVDFKTFGNEGEVSQTLSSIGRKEDSDFDTKRFHQTNPFREDAVAGTDFNGNIDDVSKTFEKIAERSGKGIIAENSENEELQASKKLQSKVMSFPEEKGEAEWRNGEKDEKDANGITVSMSSSNLHDELRRSLKDEKYYGNDSLRDQEGNEVSKGHQLTNSTSAIMREMQETQDGGGNKPGFNINGFVNGDTYGLDVHNYNVVPISSSKLYEELRRSIKEGNHLRRSSQHHELRNMELQEEVIEMSRTAAHYEAKSERGTEREGELRVKLTAAIKQATESQKETEQYKKKVSQLENMFLESEKRQRSMGKMHEENKGMIERLKSENESLRKKMNDMEIIGKEQVGNGLNNKEKHCEDLEFEEEGEVEKNLMEQHDKRNEIRHDLMQQMNIEQGDLEYENKEYRHLIEAMKEQLNETKAINQRYAEQVKHYTLTVGNLRQERNKLKDEIETMKARERGKKERAFLYLQQYRESQVQMASIQSELKKQRADNDEMRIQCKWLRLEVEKLQNIIKMRYEVSEERRGKENAKSYTVQEAKGLHQQKFKEMKDKEVIESATSLVEERMKKAKNMTKSHESAQKEGSECNHNPGDKAVTQGTEEKSANRKVDQGLLQDQHEKLSIEMALTRNIVKKLQSDNGELRQQVALLKADMALGVSGIQSDGGGVIPGKYRRGNFEVVSAPFGAMNKKRTQSMTAFSRVKGFAPYDKAQSLIDLTKVSIDEVEERRASLKKHSSDGENISQYADKRDKSPMLSGQEKSSRATNPLTGESRGQTSGKLMMRPLVRSARMVKKSDEHAPNTNNASKDTKRSLEERPSHPPLRSTISFPHTDEVTYFGNFKKSESIPSDLHAFQVPGALRVSPAAQSFNSFLFSWDEDARSEDEELKALQESSNRKVVSRKTGNELSSDDDMRSYQVRYAK
eukprot:gene16231-7605_t